MTVRRRPTVKRSARRAKGHQSTVLLTQTCGVLDVRRWAGCRSARGGWRRQRAGSENRGPRGPRPNELPFLSTREGRSPSQPAAGSAPGARNRHGSRPRTPPARPRPAIVRDRRRDVREGTHLGAELLSASPTPPVRSGARTVRVRRTAAAAALTPSAFVAHVQARVQRDAWRAA
jgi:hypothetical protein